MKVLLNFVLMQKNKIERRLIISFCVYFIQSTYIYNIRYKCRGESIKKMRNNNNRMYFRLFLIALFNPYNIIRNKCRGESIKKMRINNNNRMYETISYIVFIQSSL